MKKRSFDIEDKTKKILILSLIVVAVLLTAYLNFFDYTKCNDLVCFNTHLARCKKATFTNTQEDSTWFYAIKGTSKDKCVVYVKNVDIKLKEASSIKDKEMLCYLPRGMVTQPESDLDECHGLLKEALQDIIIKQLHVYIVQNIGQIKESIITPT
jgi:hypothetical protein